MPITTAFTCRAGVELLGEMLTPINLIDICKEPVAIHILREIPLVVAKIIIRLDEPMRRPFADMGMRLAAIAHAVLGVPLCAFTIAWPEVLPAPAVRKIRRSTPEPLLSPNDTAHRQRDSIPRKDRMPPL